jgi:hypothetical protein
MDLCATPAVELAYIDWMRSCSRITVTAHPAVSVPAGLTAAGLPAGLQLAGRSGADRRLLEIAAVIMELPTPAWPAPDWVDVPLVMFLPALCAIDPVGYCVSRPGKASVLPRQDAARCAASCMAIAPNRRSR